MPLDSTISGLITLLEINHSIEYININHFKVIAKHCCIIYPDFNTLIQTVIKKEYNCKNRLKVILIVLLMLSGTRLLLTLKIKELTKSAQNVSQVTDLEVLINHALIKTSMIKVIIFIGCYICWQLLYVG